MSSPAEKLETRVYLPDNSIRKGLWSVLADVWRELADNRWLTYQLFKRDFSALYKQSLMGMFWIFVMPVFSVSTFIILNRSGIFNVGQLDVPYPLYAVLGLAFWQLFSSGLVAETNALVDAGSMIKLINFSKKSLVIAATGRALVAFGIQILLVGGLMAYYRIAPRVEALWVLPALIPLIFLMFACGFIFSILNALMRDIGNALTILMTFLMFLTPVLYAAPSDGLLAAITRWNPLYYLVSAPRDLILKGAIQEPAGYAVAAGFSAFFFLVCLVVFHLTETKITERV